MATDRATSSYRPPALHRSPARSESVIRPSKQCEQGVGLPTRADAGLFRGAVRRRPLARLAAGIGLGRSRGIASDTAAVAAVLVLAAVLVGLGDGLDSGFYSPSALVLAGLGLSALVAAGTALSHPWLGKASGPSRSWHGSARWVIVAGATGSLVLGLLRPAQVHVFSSLSPSAGRLEVAGQVLVVLAALVTLASALRDTPKPTWALGIVIALFSAGSVLSIRSDPRPPIDVWFMFQAAGRALLGGHDIYTTAWSSAVPGEVANHFTYLPGSAAALLPFFLVFGDVRYGLVAAMVVAALTISAVGGRRFGPLLGCLLLCYPQLLFAVEQSWNDPLILAILALAVYVSRRGATKTLLVLLAAAVTLKSYVLLVVPLGCLWTTVGCRRMPWVVVGAMGFVLPWVVADPGAFWSGAVLTPLRSQARGNALSLYSPLFQSGHSPGLGLAIAGVTAALLFALAVLPPTDAGFVVGLATGLAAFNLTMKESYFNEWMLVAGLALLAAAALLGGDALPEAADAALGRHGAARSSELGPFATADRRGGGA